MSVIVKTAITKLSHLFIKRPLFFILLALFVTALLLPATLTLFTHVRTDFAALLPDDNVSVQRVKEMGERFGSVKNLIVVFETNRKEVVGQLFSDFAEGVQKLPDVVKVRYQKPGYEFFKKNRILYLETNELESLKEKVSGEIEKAKLGDLYIDFENKDEKSDATSFHQKGGFPIGSNLSSPYLTNDDESVFLFEVFPSPEAGTSVGSSKKFFKQITDYVQNFHPEKYDPEIRVSYSGGVKGVVSEYDTIMSDLQVAGMISWVLILIFLLQYYRSISLTVVTFAPLVIGMVWSFGTAYYVVGQLNMITAFLFSVLAGLGIEIGIHFTTRYFEERRDGRTPQEACAIMLTSTGHPAFMAAVTTVSTMAVLLLSDFRGFSEFGGIMSIGIMLIFLSYLFLMGPFLVLAERWKLVSHVGSSATHMVDPFFFMRRWTKMKYVVPILCLSFLMCAVSLWSLFYHVKFDYHFDALKGRSHAEQQVKEKTDAIYQAKSFPAILWAENSTQALLIKNKLIADQRLDDTKTIDRVITLADMVPGEQAEKFKIISEIKTLLRDPLLKEATLGDSQKRLLTELQTATQVSAISLRDIPVSVQEFFYGQHKKDDQQFVFISPKAELDLDDGLQSIAFAKDTRDIQVGTQMYHAVSHNLIFADLLTTLLQDMRLVIGLAFVSAFVILWFDFKKITIAALVMLPLVMGIVWMFGVMWFAKLNLNLFNMIVFPCLLGMSIDNATHIFYRLRETGIENMIQVLRMTGNAIVMSGITAIAGFTGLIAAHHGGLYSTGVLAVIGLSLTLVSGLIFFPAFLQWVEEVKK